MGAHEPVHRGQRFANRQRAETPTGTMSCSFCGSHIDGDDGEELISHRLPTDSGEQRTVEYCSPSCFIREMEQVSGIDE